MRHYHLVLAAITAPVVSALLDSGSAYAFAGDSPGLHEMRIAAQYATAAAGAQDLKQIKAQLQQALNCLVGRGDSEYRSKAGEPCRGASAMRSLPDGSINRIRVQKAIRLASVGVTFHDFKPAHFTAQAVQAVLEEGVGR